MKAKFENGDIIIDAVDFIESMDDATIKEIAKTAIYKKEMIDNFCSFLIDGRSADGETWMGHFFSDEDAIEDARARVAMIADKTAAKLAADSKELKDKFYKLYADGHARLSSISATCFHYKGGMISLETFIERVKVLSDLQNEDKEKAKFYE